MKKKITVNVIHFHKEMEKLIAWIYSRSKKRKERITLEEWIRATKKKKKMVKTEAKGAMEKKSHHSSYQSIHSFEKGLDRQR